MGKKDMKAKREYREEFKAETVKLAESIGANAAASRPGVLQSTVTTGCGAKKVWSQRRGCSPSK